MPADICGWPCSSFVYYRMKSLSILSSEVSATGKSTKVSVEWIGEGVNGDYRDADPGDIPLSRMDVMRRGRDGGEDVGDSEWGTVRNGSFCTCIDARISVAGAKRIARAAVQLLDQIPAGKHLSGVEILSWASSGEAISTGFRIQKRPYYAVLQRR